MWTICCNYYTDVLKSVPTEALALFYGSGLTILLIAYPYPQMPKWNETRQILDDYGLYLNYLQIRTINCYGANSLWTVNIPSPTSSCLKENLRYVLVSGQTSDAALVGHVWAPILMSQHTLVGQVCAHQPIQGSGQSRR